MEKRLLPAILARRRAWSGATRDETRRDLGKYKKETWELFARTTERPPRARLVELISRVTDGLSLSDALCGHTFKSATGRQGGRGEIVKQSGKHDTCDR